MLKRLMRRFRGWLSRKQPPQSKSTHQLPPPTSAWYRVANGLRMRTLVGGGVEVQHVVNDRHQVRVLASHTITAEQWCELVFVMSARRYESGYNALIVKNEIARIHNDKQ